MATENPFKGPNSYEDGDKFYGRENEIKELIGLIRNEALTLLFSRSGTGKSSLIKAGIFPALKTENEFFPIYIHLNDAAVKEKCAKNLCDFIIKQSKEDIIKYFSKKENIKIKLSESPKPDSLFEFAHNLQIIGTDKSTAEDEAPIEYLIKPVFFFDQCEEVFTQSFDKNQLQFLLKELKCLIENEVPEYLKEEIISSKDVQYLKLRNALKSKQKNFRVVFSFREEYLPQFESLRKEIPSIRFTNSRYRLEPFSVTTAKTIIVKTAEAISAETALDVSENVATQIEGFDEKRVDPFLLSLICQTIYSDLLQQNNTSSEDAKLKIKSLVESAIESYVAKVYKTINEETKKFIEKKLITSDGKKNSVNYNEVENDSRLKSDIEKLVSDSNYRLLSIGQFLDSSHVSILHDRLLPPLIKRKEDRKRAEDYQAFLVTQKEWNDKNKKKQRVLLASFIFLVIIFGSFYYIINKDRKEADTLKNEAYIASSKAKEQEKLAGILSHRADLLKAEAELAKDSAKLEKDSLRTAFSLALAAEKKLEIQSKQLISQKLANQLLQQSLDTIAVQKDLQKNGISPFTLNQPLNDMIFDSLFKFKNNGLDIQYQELLKSVIGAVTARRQILNDTIKGFFDVKELWKRNKYNPVVESIIFNFINRPVYYKQIISLPKDDNSFFNDSKILLSFSSIQNNNKFQDFTFNYNNHLYTGSYDANSDSLIIKSNTSIRNFFSDYSVSANTSPPINSKDFNDTTILLNALAYTNDTIIGLVNNSFFTYIPEDKKITINKQQLPISKNSKAILSPNSKFLITYKDFDSVILWNTSNINENKKVILRAQPNGIKSIIFSKKSDRLVILGLYGDLTVYNLDLQSGNATLIDNSINARYNFDKIQAVNFTDDGKELLAAGKYYTYVRALDKSDTLHLFSKNPNYQIFESVFLSPDFRNLLFKTPTDIFIVKDKNQDLLGKNAYSNLIFKTLYSKEKIKTVSFLNSNSIISVSDSGDVYLLKVYPEFSDLDVAFATIQQAPLPLIEQLKINPADSMIYKQILNSNDWHSIRSAAVFYQNYNYEENFKVSKADLIKSKQLYQKLLSNDPNKIYRQNDAVTLINILRELSDQDTSNPNKAMYYKQIVDIAENYSNSQDTATLSTEYGNLSFYSFFARNFKDGLKYAKKGIELDSTNNFIITNLALGYLFTKQFDSAEYYYMQYKDQLIKGNPLTFREGFKQDLRDLEAYGIITKKDELLYNEVERIRNDILK